MEQNERDDPSSTYPVPIQSYPVPIQYLHRPSGAEVINGRVHHTVARADWVLHAMSVRCKSGGRTQVRE